MRRRIVLRVFAGYAVVSVLAVLVFAIYTLEIGRRISRDALTRGLESAARTARVSVAPMLDRGRSRGLDELIAAMGKEGSVRLTVIDAKGVVLADSEQDPALMENHSNRPEVTAAMGGKVGMSARFRGTIRRWMIYVAVPVPDTAGVRGIVRVSTPSEELETITRRALGSLLFFALALLAA